MSYLADTTVFVAHLREDIKATQFLKKEIPFISTVTIAELIQGARDKKELKVVLNLISKFPEEEIGLKVPKKALELLTAFAASHGIKFLDALIAATALSNHSVLVTENIKHFKFIPELKVLSHSEAFEEA